MFLGIRLGIPQIPGGGGGATVAVIVLPTRSVLENSAVGTLVGTFSVLNGSGTYTFTLTDSAGGKFRTAGANGTRLEVNGALDYETATSHSISVSASNGVDTPLTRTFAITVLDVAGPTITSADTVIVNEAAVLAHALTAGETSTWSLVGGADLARFELSGSTLRWLSNGVKDFEAPNDADANNIYVVTVRATSSTTGETTNQTISVTVADVAAPTITSASTNSVAENATLAHALTSNQTVTWSIVGGADQARFELSGSTLRWLTNGTKNYDAPDDADFNNVYLVTVRATATATTETTNQTVSVTVTNVLEVTLAVLTLSASTIMSTSAENTVVGGLLSVTSGSTLNMTDTAGGRFKLSGSNVVAGATATNIGVSASHNITVRENHTDGSNSPRDSILTITVVPLVTVPDAPVLAMDPAWTGADPTPDFTIDINDDIGAGDTVQLQIQVSGGSWSPTVSDTTHVITTPEDTANEIALAAGALSNNSYEARCRVSNGTFSAWSNTVSFTVTGGATGYGLMWGTDSLLWGTDHLIWDGGVTTNYTAVRISHLQF